MRTSPKSRLGPDTAERLFTTGYHPAFPQLSRLHAAVSAPARPHELSGLEPALAAFEEAGRDWRPAPVKRRARLLRPLAAAVATTAVLAGGVAVAAETGNLPGARAPGGADRASVPAPPDDERPTTGHGATPSAPPTPGARGRTLSPTNPAVPGLCRAWDTHRRNPNGPPLNAEALRDLAAVAGGESGIAAFCAPLLAVASAPPQSHPGTVPPTPSHPAGKPPAKPTPDTGRKGHGG